MSIRDGLNRASRELRNATASELKAQGHHLTGALAQSIKPSVVKIPGGWSLQISSLNYQKYLHWGVAAAKASFRQFPFVVQYFRKRGLTEKEAKGAAAATIRTWMKEGMPTNNSLVYSGTGTRLKFLDDADRKAWPAAGAAISSAIDNEINKVFHQTKSETI
jgi:hypothetical protein